MSELNQNDSLMSTKQACAYLCVSRSTLARLVRSGAIPYLRVSSRMIRFDRAAIDDMMRSAAHLDAVIRRAAARPAPAE